MGSSRSLTIEVHKVDGSFPSFPGLERGEDVLRGPRQWVHVGRGRGGVGGGGVHGVHEEARVGLGAGHGRHVRHGRRRRREAAGALPANISALEYSTCNW